MNQFNFNKTTRLAFACLTFFAVASCKTPPPKILADTPTDLRVNLQGDSASDLKINESRFANNHGYKSIYINYNNVASEDKGVVYRVQWLNNVGFPLGGTTEGMVYSEAGSNNNILIGSPNGEAIKARLILKTIDLGRETLMLTQTDYNRMITSVVSQMQAEVDFHHKSLVVAVSELSNNTDDSSIKVHDMKTFLMNALQSSGHFRIRPNKNDPDIQAMLNLKIQGRRANDNKSAEYSVILNLKSPNLTKDFTSIIKFKKKAKGWF